MGLMARGQRFLNRTLTAAAGVSVVYSRGLESVTLVAIPGIEERDEVAGSGSTNRSSATG
jgi:hypothetical protein